MRIAAEDGGTEGLKLVAGQAASPAPDR